VSSIGIIKPSRHQPMFRCDFDSESAWFAANAPRHRRRAQRLDHRAAPNRHWTNKPAHRHRRHDDEAGSAPVERTAEEFRKPPIKSST